MGQYEDQQHTRGEVPRVGLGLGLLQVRAQLKVITGNYSNSGVIGVITRSSRALKSFDSIKAAYATKKRELSCHVINYHARGASKAPDAVKQNFKAPEHLP